ncbi:MAG: DUF4870 family protein [Gemmatimonadota bacterium]
METTQPVSAAASDPALGKDAAWIAYILHGAGYLTAMMWPAVIGLIINYVKRGDARGGTVDTHHDWLIRTFWYGLLWVLLSLTVLLWSAWPVVHSVWRSASSSGEFELVFAWSNVIAVIGAAALGGLGFLVTWLWLIYRVVRGAIQLTHSQPLP